MTSVQGKTFTGSNLFYRREEVQRFAPGREGKGMDEMGAQSGALSCG